METTLQIVSYANPKERTRLKPILQHWFQNPKDLHLTEPRMTYPFRFQKWVKLSLLEPDSVTYLLVKGKYVLAHLSCAYDFERRRGTLFHLIVDPLYRRQGYAKMILKKVELEARKQGVKTLLLRVLPQNTNARALVEQLSYTFIGKTRGGLLKMYKDLT
jgi:ribosomal protein S18 acetylase RimI-like enzyme